MQMYVTLPLQQSPWISEPRSLDHELPQARHVDFSNESYQGNIMLKY